MSDLDRQLHESDTLELVSKDKLFTVDEVAGYLRVTSGTVRAMAKRGEIPALKVGRSWRFKWIDIQKYLG